MVASNQRGGWSGTIKLQNPNPNPGQQVDTLLPRERREGHHRAHLSNLFKAHCASDQTARPTEDKAQASNLNLGPCDLRELGDRYAGLTASWKGGYLAGHLNTPGPGEPWYRAQMCPVGSGEPGRAQQTTADGEPWRRCQR